MEALTTESCGNNVTKAMNNSQPAFRPIGLEDCFVRSAAPSCKAFTSSNIVPANSMSDISGGLSSRALLDFELTIRCFY